MNSEHMSLRLERNSPEVAYSAVVERLSLSGFETSHLSGLDLELMRGYLEDYKDVCNDKTLKLIAESVETPREKKYILRELISESTSGRWLNSFNKLIAPGKDQTKRIHDAEVVIRNCTRVFLDEDKAVTRNARFGRFTHICLEIVMSDLYRIFSFDADKVVSTVSDLYADDNFSSSSINDLLDVVEKADKQADILLAGVSETSLAKLFRVSDQLPVDTPRGAKLVNKFLLSDDLWSTRVQTFLDFFAGEKFPIISRDLFDEKLILFWAQETAKSVGPESGITVEKILAATKEMSPEKKAELILTVYKNLSDTKRAVVSQMAVRSITKNWKLDLLALSGIDKNVLERIKRREDPFHPLNTLGIAKTVGHEVEHVPGMTYQKVEERCIYMEEMLEFFGFRSGRGGRAADSAERAVETSPGPFWDPLTAVTVFNLYADGGLIDRTRAFQTMHFNVGILPVPVNELILLVRAFHASGLSRNPNLDFDNQFLMIRENDDHAEGKVFDVVSREGFSWTMESASFLSWAIAAKVRMEENRTPNKYDKELASIWQNYAKTLVKGFSRLGFSDYLQNIDNSSHQVVMVTKQLKLIFPKSDINPSIFYRDVSKVDKSASSAVKPVVLNAGLSYVNIAHFVREVTDVHVAQIRDLANKVEAEVSGDIVKIDNLSLTRKAAIKSFLEKYKTPIGESDTKDPHEEAYQKVRKIFLRPR